jgi:triacylglycerol lipase
MKHLLFPWLAGCLATAMMPTASAAAPASRDVILVTGFLDRGSIFNPLKRHLEARGFRCHVSSLKPGDGRGGLEAIAGVLKEEINTACGPTRKISIVAFSMGGLVSRHYLQELGGAARCETFVSLSTPHHGTLAAWLYPSEGAVQMRPGSEFLAKLAAGEDRLEGVRVSSIYTPADLVIVPARHSEWARAENHRVPVALHNLVPVSRGVMAEIVRQLGG